jgi:hypothetical protein
MVWVPVGGATAWGLAALGFLFHWHKCGWRFPLGITWLGLASSAGLSMVLGAAQFLPVIEFIQQTRRTGSVVPLDLYPFSIEPLRLAELAWPKVLGSHLGGNSFWRDTMKLPGYPPEIWTPSLYLGGLTLVLALSALGLRRGPPCRGWLSVLVVTSLMGSLGQYTSPIWAARALAAAWNWAPLRDLGHSLGPLDPVHTTTIRLDGFLRDGDGSVYWWMAMVLPGFGWFRFPAKLFTFTALGLAALAGIGWDGLRTSRGRGITAGALFGSFLIVSLGVLAGVWIERPAILSAFRQAAVPSMFGPFDAEAGFRALVRGLTQAAVVLALGFGVLCQIRSRPRWAGAAALIAMTADLAVANAREVLTVPQTLLDSKPEVLRIIEDQERRNPAPGPFRIHRMLAWHPLGWQKTPSIDRVSEILDWEHNTVQAKHGINFGVEYTHTMGVAELWEYDWFFRGVPRIIHSPETAKDLGITVGQEVIDFPRRSFDIWNTRYFIIPVYPHGWRDPFRGYASFLYRTDLIYPEPEALPGPEGAQRHESWMENHDFQIRRNLNDFPRAWVVHQARWLKPAAGQSPEARNHALQEMIYAGDPIWHDPTRRAFDPGLLAWVDDDKRRELSPYLSGQVPRTTEIIKVRYPTPQQVELAVSLESPGLVILSDVYYPGWELTIDGNPAPIYPVNRMMRGAAVAAGAHHLVYSYEPRSFQAGRVVSIVAVVMLTLGSVICVLRPVDAVVGMEKQDSSSRASSS